jgi:hypothetical protein
MTGYQSKKKAASAKTIDEVNWIDHEPNGLIQPAQDEAAFEAALQKQFQRDYAISNAAQPTSLTFNSGNAEWVMRITADRRIEVNEGVEVGEAAQKVLDALQNLLRPAAQPAQRKPLTDEEIADALPGYRLTDAIDITRAIEAAHNIKE